MQPAPLRGDSGGANTDCVVVGLVGGFGQREWR